MKIVEGVSGYYFYHLSETGMNGKPALCGNHQVMHTSVPLDIWGIVSHLGEKYCKKCEKIWLDSLGGKGD